MEAFLGITPETPTSPALRIGFLASGNATDARAIVEVIHQGLLHAEPVVMICNNLHNPKSTALQYASELSPIPFDAVHISAISDGIAKTPEEIDKQIVKTLEEHEVDIVLCVGYMKYIGPLTQAAYADRIFNVHPSLLPDFGGLMGDEVHKEVLKRRREHPDDPTTQATGPTIHKVSEEYDKGEIVTQACVLPPVSDRDTLPTLKPRVQTLESVLFLQMLGDICNGYQLLPHRRITAS